MRIFLELVIVVVCFGAITAHAQDQSSVKKYGKKSIAELKQQLKTATVGDKRFSVEIDIVHQYALQPLTVETTQEAKEFATDILKLAEKYKSNWDYGNAIHYGNLVLGRVSLVAGDMDAACSYLKAASQAPGSAQLDSFGPNMTLAKELLEKGKKDAVLKYLDACLSFWKADSAKSEVAEWKQAIAAGKSPNFKAHLFY
jgi:hypothetical protein